MMTAKFTKLDYLLMTFFGYLVIILIFSVVYFKMYKNDKNTFAFNADILMSQRANALNDIRYLIDKSKESLNVLSNAIKSFPGNEASTGFELKKTLGIVVMARLDNNQYVVKFYDTCVLPAAQGCGGWRTDVGIEDATGAKLSNISGGREAGVDEIPQTMSVAKADLEKLAIYLENNIKLMVANRLDISKGSGEIWTYLDFLYFSVITQSTVGYGDILPNSTAVRMVIAVQTVLGLLILVVVLNIVVSISPTQKIS